MDRIPVAVVCRILSLLTLDEHIRIRPTSRSLSRSSRSPAAAPARLEAVAYVDGKRRAAMLETVTEIRSPHLAITGGVAHVSPPADALRNQTTAETAAGVTGAELVRISRMTWLRTLLIDLACESDGALDALAPLSATLTGLRLRVVDGASATAALAKLTSLQELSVEWRRNVDAASRLARLCRDIEPLVGLRTLRLVQSAPTDEPSVDDRFELAYATLPALRHLRLERYASPPGFLRDAHETLQDARLETLVASDADATRTQLSGLFAAQPALATVEFLCLLPERPEENAVDDDDDPLPRLIPLRVTGDDEHETRAGGYEVETRQRLRSVVAAAPVANGTQFSSLTAFVCRSLAASDISWLCARAPALTRLKVGLSELSRLREMQTCVAPRLRALAVSGIVADDDDDDDGLACLANLQAPELAILVLAGRPYAPSISSASAAALSIAPLACYSCLETLRLHNLSPLAVAPKLPRLERLTLLETVNRRIPARDADCDVVVDRAHRSYCGPSAEVLATAFPRLVAYVSRQTVVGRDSTDLTTLVGGRLVSQTIRRESYPARFYATFWDDDAAAATS